MAKLIWDAAGERVFEGGVDRGVLYSPNSRGYAWNGLVSVTESPTESEAKPKYYDGQKYYNAPGDKEYAGTIVAYTYPDKFDELQGIESSSNGLFIDQQDAKNFGLCYRTGMGNDTKGEDYGYKLHLVYNAMVSASSNVYSTKTNTLDPLNFSWPFTTTPLNVLGKKASAHLIVDSTRTNKLLLGALENRLYGVPGKNAYLPSPTELVNLFENYQPTGYGHGPFGHTTYGHGSEYK